MVSGLRLSGHTAPRLAFAALMMGALLACSDEHPGEIPPGNNKQAPMGQIDGTVSYRERMMLPPGAVVEVQLQSLALAGQPWMLATLGDEAAPMGAGDKPLYIEFDAQDMRVGGFSGCNRYSGSYSVDGLAEYGSPLAFSKMASTMMACAEEGELDHSYLQILGLVTGYSIEGHSLSLMAGPEVLATYRPQ